MQMPTPANEIGMSHLPLMKYADWDCAQLEKESETLRRLEITLAVAQEQRIRDSMWRSVIWGFGYGDGVEAEQLGNVHGEQEAVRQTQIKKKC